MATGKFAERYHWVSTPGNYGGNWCSPAPLYNYLSPKKNQSARNMDMTSFTFITNGCGNCHPGGGSLEFDREGKRYDEQMLAMNYKNGADNDFDGDYYQAHWEKTGVIEADCAMCHLPEYDFKERNAHLSQWNFKWLATAGSGLAKVEGSIKDSKPVTVKYDLSKFDKDGKISMHLVREPRNETCLTCHAKPQWKKRGGSFTNASDVHIAKGLKCVDCHAAGSMAVDSRIKGKEVHQFGKGDDPSGNVRNDLDNTLRTCQNCHIEGNGNKNAPIAKHSWLPGLHLEKLACQTCHIPMRDVKSALVQVSDVLNPGAKISPPTKKIWTFYDENMNYWNHYGELSMFTNKDKPSDPYIPTYGKYKGKIFPLNTVHSAWPGIYVEGKKGLDQPKMNDIYSMWMIHKQDNSKYPELAKIKDDNEDKIPEVNSPEEIDAFLNSVRQYLKDTNYDLTGKQVVWVNNDRMYFNSKEYQTLEKEIYEASPYASVHKYSHDIAPARAALGINGCTDCHSFSSNMFFRPIVKYPFGEDGKPIYEPQYKRLGLSAFLVTISVLREEYLKPLYFTLFSCLVFAGIVSLLLSLDFLKSKFQLEEKTIWLVYTLFIVGLCVSLLFPQIGFYVLPERILLDKLHFWISIFVLLVVLYLILSFKKEGSRVTSWLSTWVGIAIVSGLLILLKWNALEFFNKLGYAFYDFSILVLTASSLILILERQRKEFSNARDIS